MERILRHFLNFFLNPFILWKGKRKGFFFLKSVERKRVRKRKLFRNPERIKGFAKELRKKDP
jgi:hypothetical protein